MNLRSDMKIAMLHWGFPPIIGGVETHLSILCPELVKMGCKVSLLTGSVEGVKGRYLYKGVNIICTPLMDLNWLYERGIEGLGKEIGKIVVEYLNEVKPDIIHVHNMHYFSKIHAEVLRKEADRLGIPLVLTAHNSWDDTQCIELTLDTGWDHIISVSRFIKRELCGFNFPAERITVIHHGIDLERFRNVNRGKIYKKYPQLRGKNVIFHPARMGLAKGNDTGVKALRLIKERIPDVMLVMAGTRHIIDWGKTQQKDIAYIIHLINTLGLENNILIDVFTVEEVADIYAICKFSIYPSGFGEPFGLAMLESMASKKPIIVTDSGGMPEIVRNNVNGFVIGIKDYGALAKKCMLLLKNKKIKNRLGNTGYRMVKERFTARRMAEDVVKVYRKVL